MFSFAKFFVDIAKMLNVPVGVITHGLTLILVAGTVWPAAVTITSKNKKIESVSQLNAKLDTIELIVTNGFKKFDQYVVTNEAGHEGIKSDMSRGFGEVQNAFKKDREINDQKFMFLDKSLKDKFAVPDSWLDEIINRISIQTEKKNLFPYQLSSTQ